MDKFKMHVISNTHWDREWLYSFQETRMQLVDVIDTLLDLLENNPDYKFFTFDGQTVPFEDYLDIKPENRQRLVNVIKSGKLLIGPWYILPEENVAHGESIVRNIFWGHKVASSLGKVTKFGYTASSVGQCSQMPQIMLGFGIDGMFFYRGVRPELMPAEFRWQAPDGSEILVTRLSSYPRYNFFFHLFRPVVFGMGWDDRIYFWSMGGMPLRFCSAGEGYEHYFKLAPRQQFDTSRILPCLEKVVDIQRKEETTNILAGMQGMDNTMPHPDEVRIIAEANKLLGRKALVHSNIVAYFQEMRRALKNPPLFKGELRYWQTQVYSCRTYVKQQNGQTETALISWAEPWATLSWLEGNAYPEKYLELAWRYLLRNHGHDTIHGCGVDRIHLDGEYRFAQAQELSKSIMRRAFSHIIKKMDLPQIDPETIYLILFNATPFARTDVVELYVEIPREWKTADFKLVQADGKVAEHQLVSVEQTESVVRHLQDVTMSYLNQRCLIRLRAENLPPMGYKTFRVVNGAIKPATTEKLISPETNILENEFLKVKIESNGTLIVRDKTTGRVYNNLHYFEDIGETGTAWDFEPPAGDKPLNTLKETPVIKLVENGPLYAEYSIAYHWRLPAELDKKKKQRSKKTLPLEIVVKVGLAKGERRLDFSTFINNTIRDHRLRVMFPTNFATAQVSYAGTPYDICERLIEQREIKPGILFPPFPTHPFTDLVIVQEPPISLSRRNSANGSPSAIAFFTDELNEYEVTADTSRTLAITLIRAFEVKLSTVTWRWEIRPDQPGSQCLRPHTFRYALYLGGSPLFGEMPSGKSGKKEVPQTSILQECQRFILPPRALQCGAREVSLGKPSLPQEFSFLSIQPASFIVLGALKKADSSNHLILRLYNPTYTATATEITCHRPIASAWLTNLEEKNLKSLSPRGKTIKFTTPPKKILTLKMKLR